MKSALSCALKRVKKANQLSYKAMALETGIDKHTLKAYIKGKEPLTKAHIARLKSLYNIEFYKNHEIFKKHVPKSLKAFFALYMYAPYKKRHRVYIKQGFKYILRAFKQDALAKTIFLLLATALLISWLSSYYILPLILTSAIVPLVLILLIYPLMHYETLELITAIKIFVLGGVSSIMVVILVGLFVPVTGTSIDHLLTGFLEETMKLFVVYLALTKIKTVTMMKGLLVGFIVGAAVDIFETMEYGMWDLYETSFDWFSMQTVVLLRSVYTLFLGHHYMTAILGGVLVYVKKQDYVMTKDLGHPVLLQMLIIVALIHASWNFFAVQDLLPLMLTVAAINLLLFLVVLKIAYLEARYNRHLCVIPDRSDVFITGEGDDQATDEKTYDNYDTIDREKGVI